ncbi:MAG TPA: iron-sulfur cluster assembly accessory protein [Micropepsaceae bacterium]|nr:iron-sulfur cluster assembly accessory protein [Micropepsaceae bacterium]
MTETATPARSRRERPKPVRLTDAAAERIRAIMAGSATPVFGLRVGVKNAGCAGQAYTMEYATAARPLDEVIEDKGVRILIEPKSILFLIGTELDFVTDRLSQKFVFRNPNETDACGCGESVAITPASDAKA